MGRSTWSKLSNIDPRIFYAIMMILIAIPLIIPIGFPIVIHDRVREVHKLIDDLPPGAVVVLEEDGEAAQLADFKASSIAVLNHLLTRNVKIVFTMFAEDGPQIISIILDGVDQSVLAKRNYGEDYVIFGYVPGRETALASFTGDIQKTVPKDSRGTPIEQIPMMKNIRNAKDVNLVIILVSRADFVDITARQWGATFKTPIIYVTTGLNLPGILPYYPQYVKGYVWGTPGGAEYERLISKLGAGTSYMDSLSLLWIFLLVVIVLANVNYHAMKMQEKAGKRQGGG